MATTNHKDAWVDLLLDSLRRHPRNFLLNSVGSWIVGILCFSYYWVLYILQRRWQALVPLATLRKVKNCPESCLDDETRHRLESLDAQGLVVSLRKDLSLRRKVSHFMTSRGMEQSTAFSERLSSVWIDVLRFPAPLTVQEDNQYGISLIIPAHRESGSNIAATIEQCFQNCTHPSSIQVIVVDAGKCTDMDDLEERCQNTPWGDFRIVSPGETNKIYTGGRGPCLNGGAAHATGRNLTFLHSDTCLPKEWDQMVLSALNMQDPDNGRTVHACAFTFGHNLDPVAPQDCPWGLTANRIFANWRAKYLQLPYGDHVLSIPAAYFRYLGGFPDQRIMEDYVLMDLMRQRSMILPERLHIIPPPSAKCSIRRWQKFGALYVALANAVIVHRYNRGGWDANDVFDYYYNRQQDKKEN